MDIWSDSKWCISIHFINVFISNWKWKYFSTFFFSIILSISSISFDLLKLRTNWAKLKVEFHQSTFTTKFIENSKFNSEFYSKYWLIKKIADLSTGNSSIKGVETIIMSWINSHVCMYKTNDRYRLFVYLRTDSIITRVNICSENFPNNFMEICHGQQMSCVDTL